MTNFDKYFVKLYAVQKLYHIEILYISMNLQYDIDGRETSDQYLFFITSFFSKIYVSFFLKYIL